MRTPLGYLLVKLISTYDDEIKFASGVKLYIDPSYNPNWHATSVGTVIAGKWKDMQVVFSYKVVGDITFENNPKAFRMVTKQEGYVTEWINADGEDLTVQKGMKDNQWVGMLTDRHNTWLAGKAGTAGEVESWTSKFTFARAEGFTYESKVIIEDQELWKVDTSLVFGIRDGDRGQWTMQNDHVLVEPIVEKKPALLGATIVNPEADRMVLRPDKGWIRSIGKNPKLGLS